MSKDVIDTCEYLEYSIAQIPVCRKKEYTIDDIYCNN